MASVPGKWCRPELLLVRKYMRSLIAIFLNRLMPKTTEATSHVGLNCLSYGMTYGLRGICIESGDCPFHPWDYLTLFVLFIK